MNGRILILDDDKLLLGFMEEHLSMNNYEVIAFGSPVDALSYLEKNSVDLVVSDVKMNEMTGDEVMAHINQNHPDTGIILITGFGSINHSVNAIRKGAFDYITKPFTAREILYRVNRFFETALEERKINAAQASAAGKPSKAESGHDPAPDKERASATKGKPAKTDAKEIKMVGRHPHIQRLLSMLPQIAKNNAPILIQGVSGTGTEVYAHLIHHESDRAAGPYLKINCANLPSELVESTLFGHIKGSFTGAINDRKGAFDEAHGGTLLLDEVTEIDINVQAKLLRVLQEKEFLRVGSQKPIKVDVRIIATTNRNIMESIADKQFREDLYYRLNVFPINIPPLKDRKEDIPLLAQHFIDLYTAQYGLAEKKLSKELANYLMEQEWKGNVRELDNKIHRGMILSQDDPDITVEHIEDHLFTNVDEEIKSEVLSDVPLMPIDEMELQMIKKALEKTQGNQKKAAKMLGISDRTIRNKLKNSGWTEDTEGNPL